MSAESFSNIQNSTYTPSSTHQISFPLAWRLSHSNIKNNGRTIGLLSLDSMVQTFFWRNGKKLSTIHSLADTHTKLYVCN